MKDRKIRRDHRKSQEITNNKTSNKIAIITHLSITLSGNELNAPIKRHMLSVQIKQNKIKQDQKNKTKPKNKTHLHAGYKGLSLDLKTLEV